MKERGKSFNAAWALKQLRTSRVMLKMLKPGTLLLWAHGDSKAPRVMYARIRPGADGGTYDYEGVDTLGAEEMIWTRGSFTLEGSKLILLTGDGHDEYKALALLARLIRRCEESPLTEGGEAISGVWCSEPEAGSDLTPLRALATEFLQTLMQNAPGDRRPSPSPKGH